MGLQRLECETDVEEENMSPPLQDCINSLKLYKGWKVRIEQRQLRYDSNFGLIYHL